MIRRRSSHDPLCEPDPDLRTHGKRIDALPQSGSIHQSVRQQKLDERPVFLAPGRNFGRGKIVRLKAVADLQVGI